MTPDEQAKLDQLAAMLADNMPPLWRRLYESLKAEGFTESQAFALLKVYVHASVGGKMTSE